MFGHVVRDGGVAMSGTLSVDPREFAEACRPVVEAMREKTEFGNEYRYASLPLCVIDSVFSLGVRYQQVTNIIANFCDWSGWSRLRSGEGLPSEAQQRGMTMSDFLALRGREQDFAGKVFQNHGRAFQRKYAPYKADVVFEFAEVLRRHRVETFQSAQEHADDDELGRALRALSGQSQGTAVSYFFMLAGDENLVKPDRMLTRFTNAYLGQKPNQALPSAALQALFRDTAHILGVSPRELDHAIWGRQSGRF